MQTHAHPAGHHTRAAGRRALATVLGLTAVYMIVEVVAGFVAGSLALVADAGHMLADVLGLGMALVALRFAERPATPGRTYGFYRAEILAALVNSVVLLLLALWFLAEAWARLRSPEPIDGPVMIVVAAGGLAVNLVGLHLLHRHAGQNLNVRGALNEVLADLLGSVGALLAGTIVWSTGWTRADPAVSALIALLILPRAFGLLRSALDVLLEATPRHVDLPQVERAMREVSGVQAVHDLHVWTITSGFVAMSGHVEAAGRRSREVLHDLQRLLRERFGIEHATLQIEQPDHADDGACCTLDARCLMVWPRPPRR